MRTVCICAAGGTSPIDPLADALEEFLLSDHPHVTESRIVSNIVATALEELASLARAQATVCKARSKRMKE